MRTLGSANSSQNFSQHQDNFEWNAGYLMEFGLYAWRPDFSVDRKLKEGAKMLVIARALRRAPRGPGGAAPGASPARSGLARGRAPRSLLGRPGRPLAPHPRPQTFPHPSPPNLSLRPPKVRYFKALPDSVEGVRRAVERMRGLPRPEELAEEAEEARRGLLTGGVLAAGSPASGRRRRHAAALVAAT